MPGQIQTLAVPPNVSLDTLIYNTYLAVLGTGGGGGGTGNVVGPASSTDNALVRWDGATGKLIKDSTAILDANGNLTLNNVFTAAASTASSGTTTVLTVTSARYQQLTGVLSQTFQLPDATTIPRTGQTFLFNNNSSGSLIITNNGGSALYTAPAGGYVVVLLTDNSTANGVWDFHAQAPQTVTWGSGVTGLVFNTALTTSPSISAGISSAANPSFIPQRGSATTGFGGDSTHLYGSIGGVAAFTSTASSFNIPTGSKYQINGTQIAASDLSNGTTGTGNIVLATAPTIAGGSITGLTGLAIRSSGAAFDLTFASSEVLTAGRTLSFNVGDASRTLTLSGNPTLSGVTITGAGTIATGGFTLTVPATGTAALLGVAQTFSAANIFSVNGAASTPALNINGSPFTGGTATTTKPLFLIEPTGTTSNSWHTGGTMLGVNAPSGFAGMIFDFKVNSSGLCRTYMNSSDGSVVSSGYFNGSLGIITSGKVSILSDSGSIKIGNSEDVGFSRISAGNMKVTNGSSGYGTIDASGYKASGTAGATGTATSANTLTIVGGIITNIA